MCAQVVPEQDIWPQRLLDAILQGINGPDTLTLAAILEAVKDAQACAADIPCEQPSPAVDGHPCADLEEISQECTDLAESWHAVAKGAQASDAADSWAGAEVQGFNPCYSVQASSPESLRPNKAASWEASRGRAPGCPDISDGGALPERVAWISRAAGRRSRLGSSHSAGDGPAPLHSAPNSCAAAGLTSALAGCDIAAALAQLAERPESFSGQQLLQDSCRDLSRWGKSAAAASEQQALSMSSPAVGG